MRICDIITDLDQMRRNNQEYSEPRDREEDLRREEEAAGRAADILHACELAGAKTASEAIAALRTYEALLAENKIQSRAIAAAQHEIARLEGEKAALEDLLQLAKLALKLSCNSDAGKPTPEEDLDEALSAVSSAVDSMRRLVGILKTE